MEDLWEMAKSENPTQFLPKILKTISKQYKDIVIEPKEAVTEKLVSYLINGKIDLALLALPTYEPLLTEVALFEEEFLLIRNIKKVVFN